MVGQEGASIASLMPYAGPVFRAFHLIDTSLAPRLKEIRNGIEVLGRIDFRFKGTYFAANIEFTALRDHDPVRNPMT